MVEFNQSALILHILFFFCFERMWLALSPPSNYYGLLSSSQSKVNEKNLTEKTQKEPQTKMLPVIKIRFLKGICRPKKPGYVIYDIIIQCNRSFRIPGHQ